MKTGDDDESMRRQTRVWIARNSEYWRVSGPGCEAGKLMRVDDKVAGSPRASFCVGRVVGNQSYYGSECFSLLWF